ncbi:MAG: DUF4844 domain-containing protein [Flavobacteriales bacterium]|nr:DUF4844 domain-containing protein [Flavobacteriales bacterium]
MAEKDLIGDLKNFRKRMKFSDAAWLERGLNPSDQDVCSRLESVVNTCTDKLIDAAQRKAKPKRLRQILVEGLRSADPSHFDTEEREFLCDTFQELSNICLVDIRTNLNRWMYGWFLGTLLAAAFIFRRKEEILETSAQPCTKCGSQLETIILRTDKVVPSAYWHIVQCAGCQEYNLLRIDTHMNSIRFKGFNSIELLDQATNTEEQAQTRLEQIKHFRGS